MTGMISGVAGASVFGKVKLAIMAVVGTAVLITIGLLVWQNRSLKKDNEVLISDKAALETALETQTDTIEQAIRITEEWDTQMQTFQRKLDELTFVQRQATEETRRLNDVFAKHDLERLSLAKPGLVERAINNGTNRILGMFEQATGGDPDIGGAVPEAGPEVAPAEPDTDRHE